MTVDNATKVGKVLHCLPTEFDSFRQSWRLQKDDTATFTELQTQLLATEADLKSRDPVATATGDAFYGKSGGNKKRFGRGQGLKDKRTNDSKGSGDKKRHVKCFKCNKLGHYKRECPLNRNDDNGDDERNGTSGFMVSGGNAMSAVCQEQWLGDSAAFAHITANRHWFSSFETTAPESVVVGGDEVLYSEGKGTIEVEVYNGKSWSKNRLLDVRYVPDFGRANLFSIGAITERGFHVMLDKQGCRVYCGKTLELTGWKSGTMFKMNMKTVIPRQEMVSKSLPLRLWHERLGHINTRKIRLMDKNELVDGLNLDTKSSEEFFCKGCVLGAMTHASHKSAEERDCKVGEFIHADLCGPMNEASLGGAKYFVCYKDEKSGYRRVFCLKDKTETLGTFKTFCNEVEVQTKKIGRAHV